MSSRAALILQLALVKAGITEKKAVNDHCSNDTDTTSQFDAIRAYLKELDITDNVWIGLSRTAEKPNFTWTDFQPLNGDGHWREAPSTIAEGTPLCVATDAAADFQWRPLPCGGPDVASFICELPIPSWAAGPKGCLLTELPSLTVLYIPEQSALELTSDCGLDGTKRIACKGNADREEMLKQLTCTVSSEEFDDKSTKSSLVSSTEFDTSSDSQSDSSTDGSSSRTTKSSMWSSNTVDNMEYGTPTRHRRETEDTLSPVSTKSTFSQKTTTDLSWKLQNRSKLLTTSTESHPSNIHHELQTSTTIVNDDTIEPVLLTSSIHLETKPHTSTEHYEEVLSTYTTKKSEIGTELGKNSFSPIENLTQSPPQPTLTEKSNENSTTTTKMAAQEVTRAPEVTATRQPEITTSAPKLTTTAQKLQEVTTMAPKVPEVTSRQPEVTTHAPRVTIGAVTITPEVTKEGEGEYPSAISQGQLFSIIENGTMFDIIELNETVVESSDQKSKITTTQPHQEINKSTTTEPNNNVSTVSFNKEPPLLRALVTSKTDKKKFEKTPTKKTTKKDNDPKIANYLPNKNKTKDSTDQITTRQPSSTAQIDLNKEFEMLPIIKDSTVKLNRTFRKELPPMDSDEELNEYSVPKVIDFSIGNGLTPDEPKVEINLHEEKRNKTLTETLVISRRRDNIEPNLDEIETFYSGSRANDTTAVTKQEFLPQALLGEGEGGQPPRTPPTDDQPRPNRKRQLTRPQHKNFYPYFFSRMLG